MNSRLIVNPETRCGDSDIDAYIELLESVVLSYTSDNASRMLGEANRIIGILADDMSKIAEDGEIRNTKLIKSEKNNLMMDRIVKLLKDTDTITSVSRKAVLVGAVKKEDLPEDQEAESSPVKTEQQKAIEEDDNIFNSTLPAIEELIKRNKNSKR